MCYLLCATVHVFLGVVRDNEHFSFECIDYLNLFQCINWSFLCMSVRCSSLILRGTDVRRLILGERSTLVAVLYQRIGVV